jgi:hypothetical protein
MVDLGAIGAITGVIALIVSIKNYTRISSMKALDLRLELNRAFDNLDVVLSVIETFLDHVHKSHLAVLAATGRLGSGEMKLFEEDFANDKRRLQSLLGTQPRRAADYGSYTPSALESEITSVHSFQVQISALRERYQKILDSDDERRKEIRARH